MTLARFRPGLPYLVALLISVLVLGVGLGRFGVWQPAELRVADAARAAEPETPETQNRPPLQLALVREGFKVFGEGEAGGRFPSALLAILAALSLSFAVGS